MSYSVNWVTGVIFIPVDDMSLIDGNDYELSADDFWREIRRLEWDLGEGLWADTILSHNNTRTIAGTTYVPENEIINNYTITFDPLAEKVFLKGDNNNITDVVNFNGVSVIPSNSAGNTISLIDSDIQLTEEDIQRIIEAGLIEETENTYVTSQGNNNFVTNTSNDNYAATNYYNTVKSDHINNYVNTNNGNEVTASC